MQQRTTARIAGIAVAASALTGAVLFPAAANAAPSATAPTPAPSVASAPIAADFHAEVTGVDWFGRISVETSGYTGPVWMTDASGQDIGFGIVYADGTTVLSDPLWDVPEQVTVSTDDGTSVVLDVPGR